MPARARGARLVRAQLPAAPPEPEVGRVHGGGRDAHPDLARARLRHGHGEHAQHRGVAELSESAGTYVAHDKTPDIRGIKTAL